MNNVLEILWIILIYIFIQRIVWIGMGVMKKAASATQRRKSQAAVNEEIEAVKEDLEEPIEMVTSFCCNKEIPRRKAYQIATEEGMAHFFCSWQCRQEFIERQLNETNHEEGI